MTSARGGGRGIGGGGGRIGRRREQAGRRVGEDGRVGRSQVIGSQLRTGERERVRQETQKDFTASHCRSCTPTRSTILHEAKSTAKGEGCAGLLLGAEGS